MLGQTGDYSGHEVSSTGVTVVAGDDTLVFSFYASDIVRVDFLPAGARRQDSSYVVIREAMPVPFEVSDGENSLEVRTSNLVVGISKRPVRIEYRDAAARVLLAEPASGGFIAQGNLRTANFELPADLHFYGTGERGIGIDLRGYNFSTYNTGAYGYSGPLETMKINVPFLATSSGYALYFESPIPATVDLGEDSPTAYYYEVNEGELSYFFMAGPTVAKQIERYTWLTGRQPLPPKWALGYLQSKFGYRDRTEAETMVQTMRNKGIPADAIIIDLYWFWSMGDLEWNTYAFPDPAGMIGNFLAQGFKTILITEPYFIEYCNHYPFLTEGGNEYVGQAPWGGPYYLSGWWTCGCNAVLFDISNPAARTWLWDRYEDFMDTGVAGHWTDLGEPERHPSDMQHFIGAAPQVHNIYNLLWAQTLFEGQEAYRPNDRIVNLTRSGYAGIQRYGAFTWSGDVSRSFGGLAVQLPIMINAALSGLAYHSSDLGGFTGWTSPELYIRWIQFGAFNPIMRPHGVDNQATEPWGYGAEAERVAKAFIELRYRLLPYIYTLARETFETGIPPVRPLFFVDPHDPALAERDDAYMFGPSFLVAPIVGDGQRSKNVYLPEGLWVDYWTDSFHEGGTTVTVDAPLDRLPLFVRSGAIIPMQRVMDYVGAEPLDTLLLDVFPAYSALADTFYLYEDDDVSLDYQQGEFTKTPLFQAMTSDSQSVVLKITVGASEGSFPDMLADRTILATVRQVEDWPAKVFLGMDSLLSHPSEAALLQAGDGYFYDSGRDILLVKFEHETAIATEVRIEGIPLPAGIPGPQPPPDVVLEQNHPNPFQEETTIRFTLGSAARVRIEVFNLLGQRVATILDEERGPGRQTASWSGLNDRGQKAASGVYLYRLSTGSTTQTRKMILAR
jgi:alpha-glucosidase (family GH31 glycosyl hydrolase)